jgi:hypothetical protein
MREMGSDPNSMKLVEASVVEAFGSVFELTPRDVAHLAGEALAP